MARQVFSLDPSRRHGWTRLPNGGGKLERQVNSIIDPSTPSHSPSIPIQLPSTNGRVSTCTEHDTMYNRLVAKHFLASKKGNHQRSARHCYVKASYPNSGKTVFLSVVLIKKLGCMDATLAQPAYFFSKRVPRTATQTSPKQPKILLTLDLIDIDDMQ